MSAKRPAEHTEQSEAKRAKTTSNSHHAELIQNARAIASPGKGILAADESTNTIKSRFDKIGLENTEEHRRAYRELLFSAEGIEKYISGVILFDETLHQKASDGKLFTQVFKERGIIPGIKVDQGLKPLPGAIEGETAVQGLTDLDVRCKKYYEAGARFAKWRAAYAIDTKVGKPSQLLIETQATDLARYAAVCQAHGLVPIVEPEVMMDGDHDIETCARISEKVWAQVTKALHDHHVLLEGCLLKPNMITPGQGHSSYKTTTPHEIASYTIRSLKRTIPAAIPGIVFLSGGQTEEEATLNLNAMNALTDEVIPFRLSFSYGRALQSSCLKAWMGKTENLAQAKQAFLTRAKANSEAQLGKYAGGAGGKEASASLFEKDYKY